MRRSLALIFAAVFLSACGPALLGGGGESATPTPGPFTDAQVQQCNNALNSMTDYTSQIIGTQDVTADRKTTLQDVAADLNAYQFLDAPSAAGRTWAAFGTALRTASKTFAKAMTPAQYDAAYEALFKASQSWRRPCQAVRQWAEANTAR